MPDMNDFHAFKSTSGNDSGGGGCSGNIFVWILVIYAILTIIGKLSS